MAIKRNYSFEKNQRAKAKAAKREAKQKARAEAKLKQSGETDDSTVEGDPSQSSVEPAASTDASTG